MIRPEKMLKGLRITFRGQEVNLALNLMAIFRRLKNGHFCYCKGLRESFVKVFICTKLHGIDF